jgi:hypothetical protein
MRFQAAFCVERFQQREPKGLFQLEVVFSLRAGRDEAPAILAPASPGRSRPCRLR